MEHLTNAVTLLCGVAALAFYAWYLWHFHGDAIRAWWIANVGPAVERQQWISEWRRLYHAE